MKQKRTVKSMFLSLLSAVLVVGVVSRGAMASALSVIVPVQQDPPLIRIQPIDDQEAPSVPQGVLAKSGEDVTLEWEPSVDQVTGMVGCVIYRDGERVAQVEGASFKDTGVNAGETHRYQVSALDGVGNESALSAPVVVRTVDAPAGIVEAYCYPNPAVGGAAPVIHVEGVRLDSLEVKIFDTSGHLVEKGTLVPRGTGAGESSTYEFEWGGAISSGIYFGLVQGKSNDDSFRAHLKIAVIR